VETALSGLRTRGLAVRITGAEIRVPKHAHRLAEVFNLGRRESALLAELMLRGPQTAGELRARAERMHRFDDLAEVESTLVRLMEWQPAPLAVRLSRPPGSRETRYAHLLAGEAPRRRPRSALRRPKPPTRTCSANWHRPWPTFRAKSIASSANSLSSARPSNEICYTLVS